MVFGVSKNSRLCDEVISFSRGRREFRGAPLASFRELVRFPRRIVFLKARPFPGSLIHKRRRQLAGATGELFFHGCAKKRVHSGLITRPFSPQPGKDVGINADRKRFFFGSIEPAHGCALPAVDFGNIAQVDFGVGQGCQRSQLYSLLSRCHFRMPSFRAVSLYARR